MGNAKSRLYVALNEIDVAEQQASSLRGAMKGLGTNEGMLIRTLAFKNGDQLRHINNQFETVTAAPPDPKQTPVANAEAPKIEKLSDWIKDDTSGDFCNLLLAMAQQESESIADALYKSMKGLGTNDDLLIATLTTRSPTQITKAREAFAAKYPGDSLDKWIMEDTSGDYQKVLLALVDKVAYYCERINKSIAGLGTNDTALIRTILSLKHHDEIKKIVQEFHDPHGFAHDLTKALEYEFSTPTLKEVAAAYQQRYGQSLKQAIVGDTSGNYQQLLVGLLEDQGERDAEFVRQACAGAGTKDDSLIEIMVTRGEKERQSINKHYVNKYAKTLATEIQDETSFEYKKALVALAKPKPLVLAEYLNFAMKGAGTNEAIIIGTLVHRSRQEIREICEAYQSTFNKKLEEDIESETSGWFRKTLLYFIKEAIEPKTRVHVNKLSLFPVDEF